MGQCQVQEEGASAVTARGEKGSMFRWVGEAGGHQGGGNTKPGDTERWLFLPGALQPPQPLLQLPRGKSKPCGYLLPLQWGCLAQCEHKPLKPLPCLPVANCPQIGMFSPSSISVSTTSQIPYVGAPASLPSLTESILALPSPPQQALGPRSGFSRG